MVYLVMLFQSLLASGTHIVAKLVLGGVDPVPLTMLRVALAGTILLLYAWTMKKPLRVRPEDRVRFALLSFLGIPLNQFLFLSGLHASRPTNAALFYGATPALVLLLSVLMKKERKSYTRLVGITIAFAGILIVVFEHGFSMSRETLRGDILLLGAVVAWALYTVLGKDMIHKYGYLQTTSVTLIWGMFMFLPVGLTGMLSFDFSTLSVGTVGGIFYLAVATSIFAYVLWYYGLGKMAPSKLAVFANIQPVLTMVLAYFILGDPLTSQFLAGAAVTLTGVVITEFT